ncbi:MAG TPA: Calx-beta domain-containing protein, partial [Thermoanaerobaculia bacterium]
MRRVLLSILLLVLAATAGAQSLSITNLVNQMEPLNPPATINYVFTVTLSAPSASTVTVNWATADVTALAGADYVAGSGLLTFVPGDTSETITVVVNADDIDEPNEDFVVDLSNPVNATIGNGHGIGRIRDNGDFPPFLMVTDPVVTEGGTATFTVSLTLESGHVITVDWATADQTAVAPADYAASSGTATFTPGDTSETISVPTSGDLQDESDETFLVNFTNPVNVAFGDNQAVGTITDDDAAPTITIGDVTVIEGNAGTVNAVFDVTLSNPSGQTVTVNWATADQTAVAPDDYAANSGTVTFLPGDTAETVTVTVAGDVLDEVNETFLVNLTSPVNATIADNQGVGTITDDDATPSISISDVVVTEGNAGTVNAVFNVTLSAASGRTITVDYATANVGAVAPGDFEAVPVSTLTFNPGQTTRPVTVLVKGDALDEINETF